MNKIGDLERVARDVLVETRGMIDQGFMDPCVQQVSVRITPGYAEWLEQKGCDVSIMQPGNAGAYSNCGPGKFAVETLVNLCLGIVKNLIEVGVPKEVALKLLPHEIYEHLSKSP